ncbi:SDR family NAD(P)-dependent oxidoreductase [Salinicoccus roseus]|uniref:Diacetyl reductase [(S)-acetoin forming] n=1 Tax=Salinicoccus roseus TaxID=45670 RepID=A0A265E5A5_9STAP|nr:glucose 1-dehydrogenase [Salinicoccus roseus]OZT76771.1 3-alpha-hydroxysteroid dehydrogenase [Salinicoccus roseus]
MRGLSKKVAIITGGARGMGESHVRRFIEEGAKVVFTDINTSAGEALAEELGGNAVFVEHDVTDADGWKAVVDQAESAFGPVNVLVNNAGISMSKTIFEMTEAEYRKIIDINQVSVFLGIKAVLPSMQKAEGGSIVNISSMNGIVGGAPGYTDSKFAVRGLTKAAAIQLGGLGIRVNSVHPGVIETPMVSEGDAVEQIREFAKQIPMKRTAQSEEVTNMVAFLASDEASYSTGSEFIIDGGLTAM